MAKMSHREKLMKAWLIRKLKSQGYLTYAKILREFDVNIWPRDYFGVAALNANNGVFYINEGVDDEQASVVIRHEILHAFLKHQRRGIDYLKKERGIDVSQMSEEEIAKLDDDLMQDLYNDKIRAGDVLGKPQDTRSVHIGNIAGDFEISNKGYTEKDKEVVRSLKLNGELVGGLVTEDTHPEWAEMSYEEMYDELAKLRRKEEQEDTNDIIIGAIDIDEDPSTFVGLDGRVYGV